MALSHAPLYHPVCTHQHYCTSLVLLLNYSNIGDFAIKYSYFHLWPPAPSKKNFLKLKRSDFSLQIWEISWIQIREKWSLKDMQLYSTYCPSPAAPDLKWPGSEKGTRLFQATECKLFQTLKFKIHLITLVGTIYILSVPIKLWKD